MVSGDFEGLERHLLVHKYLDRSVQISRILTLYPEGESCQGVQSMRSLIVLYELVEGSTPVLSTLLRVSDHTLQLFLQPPPLSSGAFGGVHLQDHSY